MLRKILVAIIVIFFVSCSNQIIDYEEIVEEENPHVAMEKLAEGLEKNPSLENLCHGITHDIGHAAFKKYGFQEALADFENDLCGSGYMHGVTEEYIENSQDPLQAMLTACPSNYGACFHGIGHGLLLYYENDLPKAVAGCDMFETIEQQVQCSEGIFMQNFNTQRDKENKYLDPENTLFPCAEQTVLHKSACYFYSPRYFLSLYEREYDKAVEVCLGAEEEYISRCIRGVGSATMKQNIDDLDFVESVCLSVPEKYQKDCYGGLVSYYVIHAGSIEQAAKICPKLNSDFQKVCRGTVANSANFFE